MLGRLKRRIVSLRWYLIARGFLTPPTYAEGARLTPKRLLNLYLGRYHFMRGDTKLRSHPTRLTVEPTNVCNLRCPGCFTGVGETGRERSFMSLDLYRRLLAELGDYLLEIEFYNWGEPLLSKDVYTMIRDASQRGIGTIVSTNFSMPFDAGRAEQLVASGLTTLGVSLDGASQASYEQYRVRGSLERVLDNCRLVNEAKRKLNAATPRMVWEFHVFEHNVDDIETAKAMARDLDMEIAISKGWVDGPDWQPPGHVVREIGPDVPARFPCTYLWEKAVVNNDGGVAPCCGAFYDEDDFAQLKVGAADLGAATFMSVWNNESYQQARALFTAREGPESARKLICFDCPVTVSWERYKQHQAAGGRPEDFKGDHSFNDGFIYFFNRRHLFGGEAIDLQPVDVPTQAAADVAGGSSLPV